MLVVGVISRSGGKRPDARYFNHPAAFAVASDRMRIGGDALGRNEENSMRQKLVLAAAVVIAALAVPQIADARGGHVGGGFRGGGFHGGAFHGGFRGGYGRGFGLYPGYWGYLGGPYGRWAYSPWGYCY
jgi:hypothetical protein